MKTWRYWDRMRQKNMNHELGRQLSMVMVLWKRHTPGGKAVFWNMPKWSSKFPYFKEFHGILILSETGNVWHDFAGSNIKTVSRSVFKTPVLSINIYLKALCTEAVIGILKKYCMVMEQSIFLNISYLMEFLF